MSTPKIVGIHDHANWAGNWLSPLNQYSWLHAFEDKILQKYTKTLYLSELYQDSRFHLKRNLEYCFFRNDRSMKSIVEKIISDRPNVLYLNICWYKDAYNSLKYLRKSLPESNFCIRLHHDYKYLIEQPGFRETLLLCDSIITPTAEQLMEVSTMKEYKASTCQPFGVDISFFSQFASNINRNIDLVSFTNSHPCRNLDFIKYCQSKFPRYGLKHENHTQLDRAMLAKKLSSSKYVLLSSLTEASGSRILLEAIAAGCIPLVLSECRTAVELLSSYNIGHKIDSGFKLKMPEKIVEKPLFSMRSSFKQLKEILELPYNGPIKITFKDEHFFREEVSAIASFLLKLLVLR